MQVLQDMQARRSPRKNMMASMSSFLSASLTRGYPLVARGGGRGYSAHSASMQLRGCVQTACMRCAPQGAGAPALIIPIPFAALTSTPQSAARLSGATAR
jgi:hypothetical protein